MTGLELSGWARAGLAIAKAELVVTAILLFGIAPFLHVASPGMSSGIMSAPRNEEIRLLVAIGLAAIGLAWMVQIYRDARRV